MSGRIEIDGTLSGGPPLVGDCTFPGSSFNATLRFLGGCGKSFGAASGVLTRQVNSDSAFVPLSGVGPTDAVTAGNFLYLKCGADMTVQLTLSDDTVQELPVSGLLVIELTATRTLKSLAIKGVGAVEYLTSGDS